MIKKKGKGLGEHIEGWVGKRNMARVHDIFEKKKVVGKHVTLSNEYSLIKKLY